VCIGIVVIAFEWREYLVRALPEEGVLQVSRAMTAHPRTLSHLTFSVLYHYLSGDAGATLAEDDDVLLEGRFLGKGWYSTIMSTAGQLHGAVPFWQDFMEPIRFMMAHPYTNLEAVSLEMPEIQVFATLSDAIEAPRCDVTMTPSAYRRTPDPIRTFLRDEGYGLHHVIEQAIDDVLQPKPRLGENSGWGV
jgi:hypothetical protein